MSRYKYIMRDYHAIENAEIELDGITVLSGINGCGKSTLSRWLYYIVNGAVCFEKNLFTQYVDKVKGQVANMSAICQQIRQSAMDDAPSVDIERNHSEILALKELWMKLDQVRWVSEQSIGEVRDLFMRAMDVVLACMQKWLGLMSYISKSRLFAYMDVRIGKEDDLLSIQSVFRQNETVWLEEETNRLNNAIVGRDTESFWESVYKEYAINAIAPRTIHVFEDDVPVLGKNTVSPIWGLKEAIYIDTPMAIAAGGVYYRTNVFWKALREMMLEETKGNPDTREFVQMIQDLLGGDAVVEEDIVAERSLHYVSKDKKINIGIDLAATGFKTFAYMQRLLENGHLDKNTLLLIDEPEAHLHPQWIVEFARLLVLLNKKLGLKVLLASHNPDMVAALHDIAEKEGMLDTTWFYVAEPSQTSPHQFVYKNLGHEIAEIFKSFNIALDRIKEYGSPGI